MGVSELRSYRCFTPQKPVFLGFLILNYELLRELLPSWSVFWGRIGVGMGALLLLVLGIGPLGFQEICDTRAFHGLEAFGIWVWARFPWKVRGGDGSLGFPAA